MIQRWRDARVETDELFRIVRQVFLYERPIAERHRIAFYIGHLEAFDWNLLRGPLQLQSFHPEYDHLFAFGIDPVEGNLPTDQPSDWPSLPQIRAYGRRVRETLDAAFEHPAIDETSLVQLLNVAIEHRLMHAETLCYIFHQMSLDQKCGPTGQPREVSEQQFVPELVDVPSGKTTLGLRRDSGQFGWDNEFEAHTVEVPAFRIDRYKVTNGQFLKFLEAGGYQDRQLWSQDAWDWMNDQGISHPAFWTRSGDRWMWRSMFEDIDLPLDWPVYVSHAEASAYASWANRVLPTEEQWHRAAYGEGARGGIADDPKPGHFDPLSVQDPGLGSSAFGVAGLHGNGWEWTSTKFAPFHGFQKFDCYPGYSAPFFDGKHFVLKGGSVRTAACMLRPSFRNWFQPHYQYVYAGFRCVSL